MSDTQRVWGWFRRVWTGSGGSLALIVALSFGSAGLLVALPWLWQFVIDEVRTGSDPARLEELIGWMALVGVGHAALYTTLQSLRSIMNGRIQWRARSVVFAHLCELDDAFHRRWRAGDLVTRMTDDAGEKIAWFLCSGVFRAFEAALIVVVCVGAMVRIDPWLTVLVVLPLPALLVGQAFTQGMLADRYRAVQQAISAINDELTTTFGGIRIVQSAGLQPTARGRFAKAVEDQRAAEVGAARVNQAVALMYGYGWQMALVALLLVGGRGVLEGTITLGEYVTFEGCVMTLVWPMFDVGIFVSKFQQAGVALGRLDELLRLPPAPPGGTELPRTAALAARTVEVRAEDGELLLGGVDLQAEEGKMLAVVGEVGAGKSVLLQVLAGARRPDRGEVWTGGVPVERLNPEARRFLLGYVPQDPVLLSAPLRENILLGREVGEADLEHALEVSRLAQDLGSLPAGLDTLVGERGVTLSGGQQQRVALARALVARPRVLLLDDCTAALDADTEAAFWEQLHEKMPAVTAVVVTHRAATLQRSARVMVLEHGKVVQEGRHEELLAQSGTYRRIYGRMEARERAGAT